MTKFLGSSIVSFSTSAQFGGGSSEMSLDVTLVDCAIEGDSFSPPGIGSPVLFSYDTYQFYGLTDRYTTNSSTSAYPQYTVHLSNGLFLLQGVKLILNDYYGASNAIPNLVNVFGYLENSGFGNSEVNDAGISWTKVASAVNTICNTVGGTSYGGTIQHKSYKYGVDLSALPAIPAYYRINNDSISLLEFVQEVCEAGGHDFFIKLEQTGISGLNGIFKLYVVSRLSEPTPGAVASFVSNYQCSTTQKEIGQELRKDSTSKFVVGADVERMWFVTPESTGTSISGGITREEYLTNSVLPYYGTDVDGNYIVGYTYEDEPDEYYFDIDIREIAHPNLGATYTTCESELRAAKKGRDAWEVFLSERSCNKYVILDPADCGGSVTARPFVAPVPTSIVPSGFRYAPMNATGEYGGTEEGFLLAAVPKMGFDFTYRLARSTEGRRSLPSGLTHSTYYYIAGTPNPLESFTHTSCEVNSAKNKGLASANQYQFNLYYPSTNTLNQYFLRAFKIGCVAPYSLLAARIFESDLYRLSTNMSIPADHRTYFASLYNTHKGQLGADMYTKCMMDLYNTNLSNRAPALDGLIQSKSNQLFKRIKDLADNYYGRRYMVSIPSMYGAIEPESNKLRLSQVPTEAGYLDSSVWDDAYVNGLIPELSGLNTLMSTEEKFYPFIKVESAVILDNSGDPYSVPYNYSSIGANERYLGYPTPTGLTINSIAVTGTALDLWVKCSVSENIVYADNSTLFSPRAIIDLPASIDEDLMGNYGAVQELYEIVSTKGRSTAGAYGSDAAFTDSVLKNILNKFGIDEASMSKGAKAKVPDMLAVPLRSNLLCYGPWYLAGANGPVEYEKNDDLAPWNYGGYDAMDAAGFARVTDGMTNQTFDETGSVTLAGSPILNVGDQLITGGPYITDISVSVGSEGVTTQYTFQSWSSQRRLSKLTNFNSERIKRLSQVSRDLRRSYREGVSNGIWRNPAEFNNSINGRIIDLNDLPKRERSSTSHKILAGESNEYGDSVVMQPAYNTSSQLEEGYVNKAMMGLDGLLRPYSNVSNDKLSSLKMPSNTGDPNTSFDLYPLRVGHDISVVAGGTRSDDDVSINNSGVPDYRGLALKGPIVVQGWGRDINGDPTPYMVDSSGNPVLDSSGNKQFATDYLYNSKNWKTGPVDLQWDDDRGVWTIPSTGTGGGSTAIDDCGCGCDCADGYDLTLSDGTKTTRVMKWAPPSNIEIDVANGHIWLPSVNQVDVLDDLGGYYPLTYVNGSDGTWTVNLSGYLSARYSDYISEVDGSLVRGATATSGVTKSGTITFKRKDTTNTDLMSLTVVINGTIAATG